MSHKGRFQSFIGILQQILIYDHFKFVYMSKHYLILDN